VTPPALPLPLSPMPVTSPPRAARSAEEPDQPFARSRDPVVPPAVVGPAGVPWSVVPVVPGAAVVPPVGEGVCGAASALWGAEPWELSPELWEDVVTETDPAVAGEDVLFVSCLTTLEPPG